VRRLEKFARDRQAATAIEYAMIAAVVAIVAIVAIRSLAVSTNTMWIFVGESVGEATS
jgi:Flp pilus assembly pilin Flp